jgi:hypothetical protein
MNMPFNLAANATNATAPFVGNGFVGYSYAELVVITAGLVLVFVCLLFQTSFLLSQANLSMGLVAHVQIASVVGAAISSTGSLASIYQYVYLFSLPSIRVVF